MNKLENLKMVLFDFDDTLAVHSQGHRISDHLIKYMINVHSGSKELWNTSKPNLQLKKFMDYLAYKDIPMGLISGVHDCKAAERKIEWVKENYGYSLENYCVSSQEQKMIELSTIAEVNGFHKSQIALVDDYYENLGNAEKMGFTTFSPMEIVTYARENHTQAEVTGHLIEVLTRKVSQEVDVEAALEALKSGNGRTDDREKLF